VAGPLHSTDRLNALEVYGVGVGVGVGVRSFGPWTCMEARAMEPWMVCFGRTAGSTVVRCTEHVNFFAVYGAKR
jgi:hypothetical protein